ncbi:hypothetical protein ACU635_59215 [[Actinomadura] parvosata]|uniref:hypothetical protein n=1 Tax=[Actinomadura] parvosata TaxID=1955412 RepID=UPI00406D47CD
MTTSREPPQAALQVYEDLDSGALRARLSVAGRHVMAQIREVVMTVPDDGWSGYGGTGVLPTGTDLTVSIGRY